MFAFEQSLLCLGHFPNIWHAAASHLQECARILSEKGVSNFHKASKEYEPLRYKNPHHVLKLLLLHYFLQKNLCFYHFVQRVIHYFGSTLLSLNYLLLSAYYKYWSYYKYWLQFFQNAPIISTVLLQFQRIKQL